MLAIFQALHEVDRLQGSHSGPRGMPLMAVSRPGKRRRNPIEEYAMQIQDYLASQVGFCVSAGESKIPDAGTGVFLRGWHCHVEELDFVLFT